MKSKTPLFRRLASVPGPIVIATIDYVSYEIVYHAPRDWHITTQGQCTTGFRSLQHAKRTVLQMATALRKLKDDDRPVIEPETRIGLQIRADRAPNSGAYFHLIAEPVTIGPSEWDRRGYGGSRVAADLIQPAKDERGLHLQHLRLYSQGENSPASVGSRYLYAIDLEYWNKSSVDLPLSLKMAATMKYLHRRARQLDPKQNGLTPERGDYAGALHALALALRADTIVLAGQMLPLAEGLARVRDLTTRWQEGK